MELLVLKCLFKVLITGDDLSELLYLLLIKAQTLLKVNLVGFKLILPIFTIQLFFVEFSLIIHLLIFIVFLLVAIVFLFFSIVFLFFLQGTKAEPSCSSFLTRPTQESD